MATVEQVTHGGVYHGEGPVWFSGWAGLRWVDMLAGDVMTLDARTGEVSRENVGAAVAAVVRPRAGGGAIVAREHDVAVTDGPLSRLRPIAAPLDDATIRMNEGGCDPDGRFYCGSMAYSGAPGAGQLFQLDPDGSVEVVLDSVTISNGLGFSPDRTRAYYVDTPTRRIDILDYSADDGLVDRRPWVRIPDDVAGAPDGLSVDAEGAVWVALYGGSAVHRYDPQGRLDGVVELPVTQVTACTFGGENLDELFITTSQEHIDPSVQPGAGSVFRAEVGVRGQPVLPFAG